MSERLTKVGWGVIAILLSVFSIPWFLWDDNTVMAGLPLWLWYHIAWMGLTAVVLYVFTQRAWGIGIEGEANHG